MWVRRLCGTLLGLVARVWLSTLRLEVEVDAGLLAVADRPWVLSFFHGTQWALLAWKRRRQTAVMVSWSADGSLQAAALAQLGFTVVRGSTSRGGARALAAIVRVLRGGDRDAAFAVDGPRGPYGVAKAGARVAARAVGGVLVPIGSAFSCGFILGRAWDRFGIAWPFTRVTVHLGAPLEPSAIAEATDDELSAAIEVANKKAALCLEHARSPRGSPSQVAGVPGLTK